RRRARWSHLGSERGRRQGKRVPFPAPRRAGASRSARELQRSRASVRVYLRTFGCRANQYDTEAVRAMISSAGHEIVATAADADAAVFTGCAVTSEAEAEVRKAVRHAARERPALRSVVMGCAAALDESREPAKRIRDLPTVTAVVAGGDLPAVAAALQLPPSALRVATTRQTTTPALLR